MRVSTIPKKEQAALETLFRLAVPDKAPKSPNQSSPDPA